MTSEIMLLTSSAVVLAADSVVSIGEEKSYTGVNKLFRLSNDPPMGIMIYNNAEFLSIPMETIIKEFAKKVKDLNLSALDEILDEFKLFLEDIVKNSLNKYSLEKMINSFVEFLNEILESVSLEDFQKDIREKLIYCDFDFLGNYLPEINDRLEESEYLFENFIPDYFNEMEKESFIEDLKNYFIYFFFFEPFVGIVIAGFESDKFFPSYIHFKINYLYEDKFLFRDIEQEHITDDSVIIYPFAQDEVINTFINSINPYTEEKILDYFFKIHDEYYSSLLDGINNCDLSIEYKNHVLSEIRKIFDSDENLKNLLATVIEEIKKEHVESISEYVSFLPYDDLSDLAEALINITSIKMKIQGGLEAVGGPIDILVITKGDGVIWTKHKNFLKRVSGNV